MVHVLGWVNGIGRSNDHTHGKLYNTRWLYCYLNSFSFYGSQWSNAPSTYRNCSKPLLFWVFDWWGFAFAGNVVVFVGTAVPHIAAAGLHAIDCMAVGLLVVAAIYSFASAFVTIDSAEKANFRSLWFDLFEAASLLRGASRSFH